MGLQFFRWIVGLLLISTSYPAVAQTVTRYDVYEQRLEPEGVVYQNPWEDVTVQVELVSPAARHVKIGGFYYSPGVWMFRFAPDEVGLWSWTAESRSAEGSSTSRGTISVTEGTTRGPVRIDPRNSFRWAHPDGTPYYPVGLNDCVFNRRADANEIDPGGPIRFWMDQRIVEKEEYFSVYGAAGINLFRWGPENCSIPLFERIAPEGNIYLEENGRRIDEMLYAARRSGVRIYQVLFGARVPFANKASDTELEAVRRYVKYMVDRYGALVDFWELMNESTVDEAWYEEVTAYLRRVDPYRRPVSTSHERPGLHSIDINSPHWYETEDELTSDELTWKKLQSWKQAGKPVIVGEQGNLVANWDPGSALRMRLRLWTSLFAEGALMFWNSSRFKPAVSVPGEPANIYLGTEERAQIRVFRNFVDGIGADALPCPAFTASSPMRVYALCGRRTFGMYAHYFKNHEDLVTGMEIFAPVPVAGIISWVLPETGNTVATELVSAGFQWLRIPNFRRDVALQFQADSPAETERTKAH